MLERISEIQGIGLLHDAKGNPHACRKTTLIYGDNGRGKSTLATVLRSISTGDAALIASRRTLDGTLPPKVVVQFGSGHQVKFSSGSWSEQRPEVLVGTMHKASFRNRVDGQIQYSSRAALLAVAAEPRQRRRRTRRVEFGGDVDVTTHHRQFLRSAAEMVAQVTVGAFAQQPLDDA